MFITYLPIIFLFVAVAAFVFATIGITHLLGPKRSSAQKDATFECGIPSEGDARTPFSVKYCVIAILFVLFDVEVIFFYPWAVNFRAMGWTGLGQVGIFTFGVLVAFVYLVKHKVIDFEKTDGRIK